MKTFCKIIACLVAGSLLISLLTAIHIDPNMVSENTVVINSDTTGIDQQKLYEELFDPQSLFRISACAYCAVRFFAR